jgi:hypothetical protein
MSLVEVAANFTSQMAFTNFEGRPLFVTPDDSHFCFIHVLAAFPSAGGGKENGESRAAARKVATN